MWSQCETHLARATRKPNRKGETNGDMMKPIVQMLSLSTSACQNPRPSRAHSTLSRWTHLACLKVERIHIRNHIQALNSETVDQNWV